MGPGESLDRLSLVAKSNKLIGIRMSCQICHFEHVYSQQEGTSCWPDWGALARTTRQKLYGWVRLSELQSEITALNAVLKAIFII